MGFFVGLPQQAQVSHYHLFSAGKAKEKVEHNARGYSRCPKARSSAATGPGAS